MARLTTVVLALVACFFLMAVPQIALAQVPRPPGLPSAVDSPVPSNDAPSSTAVATTPSSTPPPSPPPPTPISSTSPPPVSSVTPIETPSLPPSSAVSSAPPSSSQAPSTTSAPSSSQSTPTKSSSKYSWNASNLVFNATVNGKVVTSTSTYHPPIPTHTFQGSQAKVNTSHVIIAISTIGGSVVLGAVGFAWIKLYKGRRAGWDDDELMNSSSYGYSAQADPFKSTLDQYHRS